LTHVTTWSSVLSKLSNMEEVSFYFWLSEVWHLSLLVDCYSGCKFIFYWKCLPLDSSLQN
jgi:hypothetical protein